MDKELEKARQSALDAVMRHLVPAYRMCKSQDLIDRLTLTLGKSMGEFLMENKEDLFPEEIVEKTGFSVSTLLSTVPNVDTGIDSESDDDGSATRCSK